MIVVSDTSPLNYLVIIGAIDVLPKLFGDVHCPAVVIQELSHQRAPDSVKQWAAKPPSWLKIAVPATDYFSAVLHRGEAQALSLAKELGAGGVLIDEKKGRRVASNNGFLTFGTVTVLELAAESALLELKSALDLLRKTTFQVSDDVIDGALARDAARRSP